MPCHPLVFTVVHGDAQFQASTTRIVDVSDHSVIVEMTGKTARVEAFLALVKPYGIIESARTGLMAMPRTPIAGLVEEDAASQGDTVDASLLPPG